MSKHNIELGGLTGNKVIVYGKELDCEWLDSYIIIWSRKDHPYKSVKNANQVIHGEPKPKVKK